MKQTIRGLPQIPYALGASVNIRRYYIGLALGLLIGSGTYTAAQSLQSDTHLKAAQIFVDADVRVSHDGDAVHMETYISASATNPDLLLAGGEVIFPGR